MEIRLKRIYSLPVPGVWTTALNGANSAMQGLAGEPSYDDMMMVDTMVVFAWISVESWRWLKIGNGSGTKVIYSLNTGYITPPYRMVLLFGGNVSKAMVNHPQNHIFFFLSVV